MNALALIDLAMNGKLDDNEELDNMIKTIIRSYVFQYIKHIDTKFMENIIYHFANLYLNMYKLFKKKFCQKFKKEVLLPSCPFVTLS